jgi:hypothetical protein
MRNVVAFICLACALALSAADVMRVERRKPLTANVGVVSVGLDTYWKQCPGLLEAMYDMQVDPTAVPRTFGCHVTHGKFPPDVRTFLRKRRVNG